MQTETLDTHGSDCHCTKTLEVLITEKNKMDYQYRYIIDKGKYVCLDPTTLNNYVGKLVKLRSPMYCLGDRICNICAGEMNYKLNAENIGLGCSKIATTLLRLGFKYI